TLAASCIDEFVYVQVTDRSVLIIGFNGSNEAMKGRLYCRWDSEETITTCSISQTRILLSCSPGNTITVLHIERTMSENGHRYELHVCKSIPVTGGDVARIYQSAEDD